VAPTTQPPVVIVSAPAAQGFALREGMQSLAKEFLKCAKWAIYTACWPSPQARCVPVLGDPAAGEQRATEPESVAVFPYSGSVLPQFLALLNDCYNEVFSWVSEWDERCPKTGKAEIWRFLRTAPACPSWNLENGLQWRPVISLRVRAAGAGLAFSLPSLS
jgi:hypothetical protein